MSGTLYVVATPIGNLEDITLRALRVLREVSVIAAEDTRRTAKLLQHHGIRTPTLSFHEHNTSRRVPDLVSRLEGGSSIALVSDAGTPLVSDPGLDLVQTCLARHISVEPIPGASAPLAALVASGFPAYPVTILGFAPARVSARKTWLARVSTIAHTVVFFEAPHRIRPTLLAASVELGERPLVVARELTKLHQQFLRGNARQIVECLNDPRGEFTIVVGPSHQDPDSKALVITARELAAEFGRMTASTDMTRRQAIATLSKKYARPAREIYSAIEQEKECLS